MASSRSSNDLVGRLAEQMVLGQWLGEAIGGVPRIVIVGGDAGMGKTKLLRWLLEEARSAGVLTAWGAAVEGIDVPLLAAASLLASIPDGPQALVPDDVAPGPWNTSGSQSLMRAVGAVTRAAESGPVLLVVDDLQFADEATVAFVQHLAVVSGTSATPPRLMLAVTVRSGEGSELGRRAAHRLAREPSSRRLHVGPLDEVEVRELWCRLTGAYPSRSELRDLIDVTGGSPLLIRARLNSSNGPTDAGTELLEGRFTQLPRATRRAVEMLAVLGGRVRADALDALLGADHERLLGPALDVELVVFDDDELAFEHSLYRNALLHSIGTDRARALTVDIAERVVSEPLRSMLAPGVVAAHLRLAPDVVAPEVAAAIHWEAGLEANGAGAWGLAADHFEAALASRERAKLVWDDHPQRWYMAGEAAFRDHDIRCAEHLRRSLDLANPDDVEVIAQSTILRTRGLLTLGHGALRPDDEAELLSLADRPDSRLDHWRSALLGMAAECRFAVFDASGGAALAARARAAASLAADPLSTWAVEIGEGLQHVAGLRLDEADACFARAIDTSVRAASPWHESSSRHRGALVALMRGQLDVVDESIGVGMDVARSCHHWAECSFGGALRSIVLAAQADPRVEIEAEAAAAMFRRTSYAFTPGLLSPALAYARATRGDIDGAGDALAELESTGQHAGSHRRALARLSRVFDRSSEVMPGRSRPRALDLSSLPSLASAAGDAVDLGDAERMTSMIGHIDDAIERGVLIAPGWPHFFPRLRAEIAVSLGEPIARSCVDGARALARREGLEFELVLLDLLSSRLGHDAEAVEDAAAALRRADAYGLLAGVVLSQDRLRELGTEPGRPIARAVLTTDIVSSTDLTRSLGDETWLEVLDEHDALVAATVRHHGGVIFKHTGDGMYAWFATATDAVRSTEVLLAEFEGGRLLDGRVPVRIRAGIALGSPLSRGDGDLFGMTVIEAARLCSAAPTGTGLASASVAATAERSLATFGRLDLKGFDGSVEAFLVEPVG